MTKRKKWSELTTQELAAATKEFDAPTFRAKPRKATRGERSALARVQARSTRNRFRIALMLDKHLVEATDDYAAKHGVSFSEVVADALRGLVGKKPA